MKRREFNKTLVAGAAGLAGLGAAVPEKKWKYRCTSEVPSPPLPEWFKSASEFMKKPLLPKQKQFFDDTRRFRGEWDRVQWIPHLNFHGNPGEGKTHLILYAIAGAMLGSYPFPTDVAVLDCNDRMKREWVNRLRGLFAGDCQVSPYGLASSYHFSLKNAPTSESNIWVFGGDSSVLAMEGYQFDAVFAENCSWNDSKQYRTLLRSLKPSGYSITTYDLTHQG